MLQLRHLKIFLAAADCLSFTRAASMVHLSQPSVTEQIRNLENIVGQPLFHRQNNMLSLTLAGERLAVHARQLLIQADEALRSVRDSAAGIQPLITVAAPQTLCNLLLLPLLAEYADNNGRITVLERNSAASAQAVRDGTADLGVIHGLPPVDTALRVATIAHDTAVVAMPPNHPLAKADHVTPGQLASHPLVATAYGCRYRRYLDETLEQVAMRPTVRALADSIPTLLNMVAAGLGVALLPGIAAAHNVSDIVTFRPLAPAGKGLPIVLLTPNRPLAPHVAAFMELLYLDIGDLYQPMPALDVQYRASGESTAHQKKNGVCDVAGSANAADR